jgi:hypothetical protein
MLHEILAEKGTSFDSFQVFNIDGDVEMVCVKSCRGVPNTIILSIII